MHQTQYPKIIAFVEGTMEKIFINNNFHYVTFGACIKWRQLEYDSDGAADRDVV